MLVLLLAGVAAAQTPGDTPGFSRILAWGSRPWERVAAAPLTLEVRDEDGRAEHTFYFPLEAEDLPEAPHLPFTRRERVFAGAVERILHEQGPAPWPVYVFSVVYKRQAGLDALSLATTRRIIVREGHGGFEPAVAILWNAGNWAGPDRSPVQNDDRLCTLVARHEVFHARRAWAHAAEIGARADAVEARLRGAGIAPPDRIELESLIRDGLAAEEEMEASDASAGVAAMIPQYRQGFLEYREQNSRRRKKIIRMVLGLFPSASARDLEKWVAGILR